MDPQTSFKGIEIRQRKTGGRVTDKCLVRLIRNSVGGKGKRQGESGDFSPLAYPASTVSHVTYTFRENAYRRGRISGACSSSEYTVQ